MTVSKKTLDAWLATYKDDVASLLGIPSASVPELNIVIGNTSDGAGAEANPVDENGQLRYPPGTILIDTHMVRNGIPADVKGALVHELAHAVYTIDQSQYADPTAVRAAIERIADAVRYRLVGDSGGWVASPEAIALSNLNHWQLKTVESAMISGSYSDDLVTKLKDGTYTREMIMGDTNADGTPGYSQILKEGSASEQTAAGVDNSGNPFGGPPPGGGAGDAEARRKQNRQQKAEALYYIQGLGIPITDAIQQLINQAAQHDWTQAQLDLQLQSTQEFKDRFPGIFNTDGTLKMSLGEYIQTEKMYQSYASQYGINMSDARMAYLFKNDVTPDEFSDRATAFSRLRDNPDLYNAFKRELVQNGAAKPSDVNTNKELFKFLMGEGNKKWAEVWQDSITRYQANQAGIAIAKNKDRYTSIGQKALEHISNLGLSEAEMGQRFAELSATLGQVLPLQEADLYGVNRKAAVAAAFGGKNSERAKEKIQRALQTDEAFYADRAQNAVYSDEQGGLVTQGVTDRSKQQQSGY